MNVFTYICRYNRSKQMGKKKNKKKNLSHIDQEGIPGMVDISHKRNSLRVAVASGKIYMSKRDMKLLKTYGLANQRGSIVQSAVLAGTMAVKNTWNTIPLCHQIPINSIRIKIEARKKGFNVKAIVKSSGQTGVEMEALHGVNIACLTIYDMCKALSHNMEIHDVRLEKKTGGKNDYFR